MTNKGAKLISLPLLALPTLYIILRLLTAFPVPPGPVKVYPSLASLPLDSRSWKIYPEDFYEGGNYVDFPYGRVRLFVLWASCRLANFQASCLRFDIGYLDRKQEKRFGGTS